MKVKPADPAAVIRDPHTRRPLPAEGAEVPENSFWTRRLLASEVVRVDDPAPEPPTDRAAPRGDEPLAPLTTRVPR